MTRVLLPLDTRGDRYDGALTTSASSPSALGQHLKSAALRDFSPPMTGPEVPGANYKLNMSRHSAPVPQLLRYALTSTGLTAQGPAEKVAWWVDFTYKGQPCQLAHEKFGLRIYMRTDANEQAAKRTLAEVSKKLRSSIRAVERAILADAPTLLGSGDATVVNQHSGLSRAYRYFRERAASPLLVEDVRQEFSYGEDGSGRGWSFVHGESVMRQNAFHDLVAAITAYLSLLEHDLVLSLSFQGFDPNNDSLLDVIGSRWKEKFTRVLGSDPVASRYRDRLTDVVERWRNPYSHGGFEKGHRATLYIQAPGVGTIPVGLSSIRDSPRFSLFPAEETEIAEVFALFDEIDDWLRATLADPMAWIESVLDVRFDSDFRLAVESARNAGRFAEFLELAEHRQSVVDNMDY